MKSATIYKIKKEGSINSTAQVNIFYFQLPLRIDSFQSGTTLPEKNAMVRRVGKQLYISKLSNSCFQRTISNPIKQSAFNLKEVILQLKGSRHSTEMESAFN